MRRKVLLSFALLIGLLVFSQTVPAQYSYPITGQITTAAGNPVSRVAVVVTDLNNGTTYTAYTSTFGYYSAPAEYYGFYLVQPNHGRYTFTPEYRFIQFFDDHDNVNFTANPL